MIRVDSLAGSSDNQKTFYNFFDFPSCFIWKELL